MKTARERLEAKAAALSGTKVDPTPSGAAYREAKLLRETRNVEESSASRRSGAVLDAAKAALTDEARAVLRLRARRGKRKASALVEAALARPAASEVAERDAGARLARIEAAKKARRRKKGKR